MNPRMIRNRRGLPQFDDGASVVGMIPNRHVYVLGGASTPFIGKGHPDFVWPKHPDFGKRENPTLEEHLTRAIMLALETTGVPASAIQRGFVANFAGETFASQGHLGAMAVRAHPDLAGKPWTRVEAACASGGCAVVSAVEALQAGYDVALVAGAEVQTTVSARVGADYLARAAHYALERSIDEFTFPAMFARRWKAYSQAHGVTDADLGHVGLKAYQNANRNPLAHMRTARRSLEWCQTASDQNARFLQNEELKEHLKMSDCSQVSDGGSALVLCTESGLARLGKRPSDAIQLRSVGQSTGPLAGVTDLLALDTTALAAAEVFGDTGVGREQVGVVEVHDCFTITEWLMLEALGFAARGRAPELTLSGATAIDGRLPVNTGGGLVGFGHPVGATGIKQVVEVWRQMKGLCGDYQIASRPVFGVTANMGGDDRTAVVTLLENVA